MSDENDWKKKSEEFWKEKLTPLQFAVAREAGTERAFANEYWDNHENGIYTCVCCGAELFDSKTKFDSGTGWPSFYDLLKKDSVETKEDNGFLMNRTEVLCKQCDAHLGHLFDDGPEPTGLRYCMNLGPTIQEKGQITMGLQQQYAPKSICFGCGPANSKGLRINSEVATTSNPGQTDKLVAKFKPESHHEAFPGMVNGGIIGSLLDCHSNWTAAHHLMKKRGELSPPCTVTAEYTIKLLRPTPSNATLELEAWVVESKEDRATIEGTLTANGKVCATCKGLFVAVKEGHPAYHRWEA